MVKYCSFRGITSSTLSRLSLFKVLFHSVRLSVLSVFRSPQSYPAAFPDLKQQPLGLTPTDLESTTAVHGCLVNLIYNLQEPCGKIGNQQTECSGQSYNTERGKEIYYKDYQENMGEFDSNQIDMDNPKNLYNISTSTAEGQTGEIVEEGSQ